MAKLNEKLRAAALALGLASTPAAADTSVDYRVGVETAELNGMGYVVNQNPGTELEISIDKETGIGDFNFTDTYRKSMGEGDDTNITSVKYKPIENLELRTVSIDGELVKNSIGVVDIPLGPGELSGYYVKGGLLPDHVQASWESNDVDFLGSTKLNADVNVQYDLEKDRPGAFLGSTLKRLFGIKNLELRAECNDKKDCTAEMNYTGSFWKKYLWKP